MSLTSGWTSKTDGMSCMDGKKRVEVRRDYKI